MCGIVGIAGRDVHRDDGLLVRMRDTLAHRGPDDAGAWWSTAGNVGLGHRRLSIVDLSSCGHQPMHDGHGDLGIVFNGEIYNFRSLRDELRAKGHTFRSATDTEVILAAYREWGTGFLQRLSGMFAFAIHDARDGTVLLARDRAGEKPLFYSTERGQLLFASELKAIMAHPEFVRRLDPDAFEHYLAYGYVTRDLCMLAGVQKLTPGTAMRYRIADGSVERWTYWELPAEGDTDDQPEEELVDRLHGLLRDAVRRQLVADVKVGVLLSGGLDSSLVTAVAAENSTSPIHTFTISFPDSAAHDEAPFARTVASHFGTRHTELVAEAATLELLPDLVRQFDEPIADSSMLPTFLVSRLVKQHAAVALGGDGGDELFGGYTRYAWVLRQEHLRPRIPLFVRNLSGMAASRLLPVGVPGRTYLSSYRGDIMQSVSHLGLYFDATARRALRPGRSHGNGSLTPENRRGLRAAGGRTPLQKLTRADFGTYMVDDILVKVDRASMLASLEVRAPWLDHHIIEFAFSQIPDHLRATKSALKVLPKMLGKRLLPPTLDLDRKQGFSIPLAKWFKGDWGAFFTDVLSQADPGVLNPRAVRSLLKGQRMGLNNAERLFALTLFELWRREYRVAV